MLSICIPIYKFDVRLLIGQLTEQMNNIKEKVELVLIDDASNSEFLNINQETCETHHYIKLDKNIGRSRIRNLFLEYASYDNLLFLDCDSIITESDFIEKYLFQLQKKENNIVCGGRIYPSNPPEKKKMLRWKYGIKKESQTAENRQLLPNHSFMTNNFLIKRILLEEIKFDERLSNYGHEDTLFGFELMKAGIPITHIHNPVGNGDIEDNDVFLEKTEAGVENLALILNYMNHDSRLIAMVKLLRANRKLQKMKLSGFVLLIYSVFRKPILLSLNRGPISLYIFDFYKLSILLEAQKAFNK
ncbi:MAG: glycosyltransferase [Bacteroidales bacterium]|nr:glycosyltransferase [Bacteroidales bacterium]